MATLTQPGMARAEGSWTRILVPELWASLAIMVMWLSVLFAVLYGPDMVSTNGVGANSTTIPSGVALALFAFLGTWVVAKYGFRHNRDTDA